MGADSRYSGIELTVVQSSTNNNIPVTIIDLGHKDQSEDQRIIS